MALAPLESDSIGCRVPENRHSVTIEKETGTGIGTEIEIGIEAETGKGTENLFDIVTIFIVHPVLPVPLRHPEGHAGTAITLTIRGTIAMSGGALGLHIEEANGTGVLAQEIGDMTASQICRFQEGTRATYLMCRYLF